MANGIPWLEQFQSKGRVFRPGMELTVVSSGRNVGKTRMHVDIESDDSFRSWRATFLPHFVEYRDISTGETEWKKLDRQPRAAELYVSDTIVRKNEDGTYEYVKHCKSGELCQLTEEEIAWMLLHV